MHPFMLGRLFSWMSRKPVAPPVMLAAPTPAKAPTVPRASIVTYESVVSEVIARDPAPQLEPETWAQLVKDILARPDLVPDVPTAFPGVAARMLDLLRDPNVDLNALVGVVQRDAGIATSLLRVANSAAFATAAPVTTLRGAIALLGARQVFEIVMCNAGKSFYDVPSRAEVALFPNLWPTMFGDAIANAFTTGRLALDLPRANSERALILGLLADVGRPAALRVVTRLSTELLVRPTEDVVTAALEEVAPAIGRQVLEKMGLPDEIRDACFDATNTEARASRLVSAVGAIQRRSPRAWGATSEIRANAEGLGLDPLVVRMQFTQRTTYVTQAKTLFGG